VMLTMVLPQITPVFEEANIDLPLVTQALIVVGKFITTWWWGIVLAAVIGFLVLADYSRTREGKVVFDEVSLRLPILGGLFQKLFIARFAESARVLIQGGLTIPQAIEISSHTVGNTVYEDILHGAAQNVRKGVPLSQALRGSRYFPPLVSQLVAVGEATGRLENLLMRVSQFYTRQVDDAVSNLVELIQPILLVVIGLMVAGLFAAILLPLYSMTQTFGG
ncbi:MAG: type II secretion system F family protein, partial [Patescibacteria group bacterium]